MSKEAAKLNSTSGVAFLIDLMDDSKLPKLRPESIASKMAIHKTLVNRRAVSPDVKSTYSFIF